MPARRTSVLVVEDEALISDLVAEILSEGGFAVHAVAAGEEATPNWSWPAIAPGFSAKIDLLMRRRR